MPTPTSDKMQGYYSSKLLAAEANITVYTADASGDRSILRDVSLSDPDGTFNGTIGRFTRTTTTVALRGQYFHVEDHVGERLFLSKSLPALAVVSDTYELMTSGGFLFSDAEIPGMNLSGVSPDQDPYVPAINITGLTITKASGSLGEGTLHVRYDKPKKGLFMRMDSDPEGPELDLSADETGVHCFSADGKSYIRVNSVLASLPATTQSDQFTVQTPENTLTPDYEGYETSVSGGLTRYRVEAMRNDDPVDQMVGASVYISKPVGADTTATTTLTIAAGTLGVTDALLWPARGFWIRNTTLNDCRYVGYRSGNDLHCYAADEWATLEFLGGENEIFRGDIVVDAITGATGVVDQIEVVAGDWGTLNAQGVLLLKSVVGVFGVGNDIEVLTVYAAEVSGLAVKGLRGLTAQAWAITDVIELMPDVDIAVDLPVETPPDGWPLGVPDDVYQEPDGLTWVSPIDPGSALAITDMESGRTVAIWRREWIMDAHQPRPNISANTIYDWS